jgi:hypothetical protein
MFRLRTNTRGWPRLAILAMAGFVAGCGHIGNTTKPKEAVQFVMNTSEWSLGFEQRVPSEYGILEYVHPNEDIYHWHEMITVQTYLAPWRSSPESLLDERRKAQERACPGITNWKILDNSTDSLTYEEVRTEPCQDSAPECEIGKILFGKNSTFMLRFTARGTGWATGQREKWLKTISDAKVVVTPLGS